MKISQETLNVLKLFSQINGGILLEPGNKIYSSSETSTIISYAEVKEEFPKKFVTVDLQKFLATVSLFEDPNFEFEDEYVTISSNDNKNVTRYYYSNEALVRQRNRVPKPQESIAFKFNLSKDDLQKLFKSISVLNVDFLKVHVKDGSVVLSVVDKKVSTSNFFDIVLDGECVSNSEFSFFFKKGNLKLEVTDYEVEISETGLGKFTAIDYPSGVLVEYIVTEAPSED